MRIWTDFYPELIVSITEQGFHLKLIWVNIVIYGLELTKKGKDDLKAVRTEWEKFIGK